ncbi:MAG: HAD family hydrolase, partial [Gammaproteobacteria bacterium]|nr:HAD family hydrolase [Gammaproteobacteria bacterium]
RALLFDVDGTLAETEEVHRVSFNHAFAAAGLDWVWSVDLYRALLAVTGGKERMRYYLDTYRPDYVRPANLDELIAGLHQAKTRIYTETVASGGVPLRPGVRRLLEQARGAGLRLAIATTTTPDNVTALLNASLAPEGEAWFEVIAAGSSVPKKKPAPDVYYYAMEQLGLGPEACLAFEDSENGLIAARAAGLKTLVTVSDFTQGHDFSGAALLLDQLGEPDAPFHVLAGDAGGACYVDIDLLKRVHAR